MTPGSWDVWRANFVLWGLVSAIISHFITHLSFFFHWESIKMVSIALKWHFLWHYRGTSSPTPGFLFWPKAFISVYWRVPPPASSPDSPPRKTYFPSSFGKGGFALLNFISCSVGCSKHLIMFSLYSVENGAFNEWLAQRTGKGSTCKSLSRGDGWESNTWSQAPGAGSVWDIEVVYCSLLILQWGNWGPGVSPRLCPFSLVHACIWD